MIVNSGTKPGKLARLRADQQGADEQVVPGKFVDHADVDAMLGLRAAVTGPATNSVSLSPSAARKSALSAAKCVGRHRLVRLSHQMVFSVVGVADDELVLARERPVCLPVLTTSGPSLASRPSPRAHRLLDQRRGGQIPVDFGAGVDTLRIKPDARDPLGHVESFPSKCQSGGGPVGLPPHCVCGAPIHRESGAAVKARAAAPCSRLGAG